MTATFYISMTSGIMGPEGKLTKKQADKAAKLVQQLTEKLPLTNASWRFKLHPTNYIVSWNNADSPIQSVHVESSGLIMLWMKGDSDWSFFKDTVGLWGYLAPFGQKFLRKWLDGHEKAMKEYHEKLALGVNNSTYSHE